MEQARDFNWLWENLGKLKDIPLERNWKIILEGALFEGWVGNVNKAWMIMRFLMNKCQTYGPVFLEAAKFEERIGNFKSSFEISEEGLYNNEKFSPLWFQYLKMLEWKGNVKLEELSQLCDDA